MGVDKLGPSFLRILGYFHGSEGSSKERRRKAVVMDYLLFLSVSLPLLSVMLPPMLAHVRY